MRFGRLIVESLSVERTKGGKLKWICKCDCGTERIIDGQSLTRAKNGTKSCGCIQIENTKFANTKHGYKGTSEYGSWTSMLDRCTNIKSKDYKTYGRRGITVCDRWLNSFENFIEDMGDKPNKNMSIERKDTNGNYCVENCIWATSKEQNRNRRNNLLITIKNETRCSTNWDEIQGFKRGTVAARIRRGWSHFDAVNIPIMTKFSRKQK